MSQIIVSPEPIASTITDGSQQHHPSINREALIHQSTVKPEARCNHHRFSPEPIASKLASAHRMETTLLLVVLLPTDRNGLP